jgi:putative membrane protein
MMMFSDSTDAWGWILMTATMVAVLGLAVLAGVAVYRRASAPAPIRTEEAYRDLAERFARGELDEAEYLDRLRRLRARDQA